MLTKQRWSMVMLNGMNVWRNTLDMVLVFAEAHCAFREVEEHARNCAVKVKMLFLPTPRRRHYNLLTAYWQLFFLACIQRGSKSTQKRNSPQWCLFKWPFRQERVADGERRHVQRQLKVEEMTNEETNLITIIKKSW